MFSFGIIMCQMIARIDADPEAGLYRTNNFGLDYIRFPAHCQIDTPLELLKLTFQCCLVRGLIFSICLNDCRYTIQCRRKTVCEKDIFCLLHVDTFYCSC